MQVVRPFTGFPFTDVVSIASVALHSPIPPPPGFPPSIASIPPLPPGFPNLPFPPPPPGFRAPAHAAQAPLPAAPVAPSATISAEAQLRGFKKQSAAFVPALLQPWRGGVGGAGAGRGGGNVNSGPVLDRESPGRAREADPARPDLVSTLKGRFRSGIKAQEKPKVKDDYEKFIEGLGDILGPTPQK